MIVHHDQDPVGVGCGWTSRLLLGEGVRVFLFTPSLRGAGGNPEMDAFFSRFQTANRGLVLDCQTLSELTVLVAVRIDSYDRDRRHSKIGYVAPLSVAQTARVQP